MAEGFGGKFKEFFGLGGVETYTDPYYQDEFDDSDREPRHARDEDYRDYARPEDRADVRDMRKDSHRYAEDRYADSYDSPSTDARLSTESRHDRLDRPRPSYMGSSSHSLMEPPHIPVKTEPHVIHLAVTEFRHSSQIVRDFLRGDIVVFSLAGADTEEAKRILDFCLGLSKGAGGELDKLDGLRNFILIPRGITLTASQRVQILDNRK